MKIYLLTLGCAKNQVDSERLAGMLEDAGHELVEDVGQAEVALVNTCGFIVPAVEESLDAIFDLEYLKKTEKICKIGVIGCLVNRYGRALERELPVVDFWAGADEPEKVVEALGGIPREARRALLPGFSPWSRYLKISEGCDNRCSYCTIPLIRGGLKSRSETEILEDARRLAESGAREICLVGQDLSAYGMDKCGKSLLPDLSAVRGQFTARRALEVAAAGGHNILMVGSPGSGKTLMARSMAGILPEMSFEESIETTKIYSLAGLLRPGMPVVTSRPFRTPHHSASAVSLVGGGKFPRPGEVSLCHNGILFLDEMPEFNKDCLEALRQPIEDGVVTISRVNASITYPARIILVGACNPCPCGYHGDPLRKCDCTPMQIKKYLGKISGPILDRIDISINIPRLSYEELNEAVPAEPSEKVRERVVNTRKTQEDRFKSLGIWCNSHMTGSQAREYSNLSTEAKALLKSSFKHFRLSARSHDKLLKVGRTIADLAGCETVEADHLAEALQYRYTDTLYY